MSLGLGRPAEDGQAPTDEESSETGTPAEPAASDSPGVFSTLYGSSAPDAPTAPDDDEAPADQDATDVPATSATFVAPAGEAAPEAPEDEFAPVAPLGETPSVRFADEEDDEDEEAAPVSAADALSDGAPAASSAPAGWSQDARLEESAGDLEGPLLGDVAELRASWQQVQAGFVDDPAEAVADAAELVEHTAQALVGALQQRQRLLRTSWDRGRSVDGVGFPASGSAADPGADPPAAADVPDTEHLRVLIQQYRTLFTQICRP
jgi:hypothetical protein